MKKRTQKPSGVGLLERARQIRAGLRIDDRGRSEVTFEAEPGITSEEKKEIWQQINRETAASRIAVTPESLVVKAAKRGVLFPVTVALGAAFALVAGWYALRFFFQQGETRIATEEPASVTAEGRLIAELKKESEAKLLEKNQEIDSIQGRLAEIDRQRQDLQSNLEAKVKSREDELRQALAEELDAERERLRGQGLSDAEVTKRVADLEARKNAEAEAALTAFRQQAEADRQKQEESLQALQTEYSATLARAESERQKVLADAKTKEDELRAQLATSTAALESQKAQAESALATLAAQKEKEDLATSQLVALYATARQDIAARDYDRALQSLTAIRSYVGQSDVAALPAVAKRRETDLFVTDLLASYVSSERDKAATDTATLVALTTQLAELRSTVAEADRLARAGAAADAEKLYGRALELFPEVSRSHAYFVDRTRAAEAARQETLRAGLAKAEAAFDAGRYAESVALYREALAYLPESAARVEKTIANLAATGTAESAARGIREQTEGAKSLMARADEAAAAGRWDEALAPYLEVLERYPQAQQATRAVQGIRSAVAGLGTRDATALAERERSLASQLAEAQRSLAEAAKTNEELAAKFAEAERVIAAKEADRAAREAEVAAARQELAKEQQNSLALLQRLADAEAKVRDAEQRLAGAQTSVGLSEEAAKELAAARQELAKEQETSLSLVRELAEAEAKAAEAEKKLTDAQNAGGTTRATLSLLASERDVATQGLAAAKAQLDARGQRIAELERELAEAQREITAAAAASTAAPSQAAIDAALANLSIEEKAVVDALKADYKTYQDRMSRLDPKTLASNVIAQGKALGYRNTFLSTASMQKTFPGLGDAIRRYDEWWKAEGRLQVIVLVTELVGKATTSERRQYYEQQMKRYAKDETMLALLRKLEPLTK